MICFNCRKSGHGVQDCPEKTHGMDKNLKSRVCFICGSKDHRALQCPSNPRGLYPDGGGCKFCGDVTHLYMACPKKLGSSSIETLSQLSYLLLIIVIQGRRRQSKKVKFVLRSIRWKIQKLCTNQIFRSQRIQI